MIPREFINDVIARIDIVDLIHSRVPLKKTGKNFSACCPFHQEKTPSFTVSPSKQFYHCFGCGMHGNAISFLMDFEHASFIEAIETLAQQVGLEIPQQEGVPSKTQTNTKHLYELLAKVNQFYQHELRHHPEAKSAVQYLKQRGLTGHIAKQFNLGYAPSGWQNVQSHLGLATKIQEDLITTGVMISNKNRCYDRFRQRIIFPIRDLQGRTIGFGGRTLTDETPKYLNSPETPLFHKGKSLYGLYEALQTNRHLDFLLVVEGYLDVIALVQHGITKTVATLGTAITKDHLQLLFRYVSDLIFCFDGDQAGKTAAWRALETSLPLLMDGRSVRFLFLPDNEDPDSMVRKESAGAFQRRIAQTTSFAEFFFSELLKQINLQDPSARAKLKEKALPLLEQLPHGLFREQMLEQLARHLRLDREKLSTLLSTQEPFVKTSKKQPPQTLTPLRLAILLLLQYPQLIKIVEDPDQFATLQIPGIETLQRLVTILKTSSTLTTGGLLEYWRGENEYSHLVKLANWELELPEDSLAVEFAGALKRLAELNVEQTMEKLLTKASFEGLNQEERHQLQQLITSKKVES